MATLKSIFCMTNPKSPMKNNVISKYLFRNFRTEINFITINDTTPASKFLAPSVPAIRGDTTPSHR